MKSLKNYAKTKRVKVNIIEPKVPPFIDKMYDNVHEVRCTTKDMKYSLKLYLGNNEENEEYFLIYQNGDILKSWNFCPRIVTTMPFEYLDSNLCYPGIFLQETILNNTIVRREEGKVNVSGGGISQKYSYITQKGKIYHDLEFDKIEQLCPNVVKVYIGGKCGLLSFSRGLVIPIIYKDISVTHFYSSENLYDIKFKHITDDVCKETVGRISLFDEMM